MAVCGGMTSTVLTGNLIRIDEIVLERLAVQTPDQVAAVEYAEPPPQRVGGRSERGKGDGRLAAVAGDGVAATAPGIGDQNLVDAGIVAPRWSPAETRRQAAEDLAAAHHVEGQDGQRGQYD